MFKDFIFIFSGFSKAHKEDKGSLIFFAVNTAIISLISFVEWFFTNRTFTLLSYIGIGIALLGLFIRMIGAIELMRQHGCRTMVEQRRLVTGGIYSRIRHPCYLGVFIALFGIAIFFTSYAGVLVHLFVVMPIGVKRLNREESALQKHFGKRYADYLKTTKKIIPWIY